MGNGGIARIRATDQSAEEGGAACSANSLNCELSQLRRERATTLALLEAIAQPTHPHELARDILAIMHNWTDCDAVAIRLREGEDFPYFEAQGFSESFVERERSLCILDSTGQVVRDAEGTPVYACMCGTIIRGDTDPSLPFFTEAGSFWTASSTELLRDFGDQLGQHNMRGLCHAEGYESIALIPLRHSGRMLGLLQFNDRRRNVFDADSVIGLERLAASAAIGLAQRETAASLATREAKVRSILRAAPVGIGLVANRVFTEVNDRFCEITGYDREELLGQSSRLIYPSDEEHARVGEVKYAQIRAKGTGTVETRVRHKDGRIVDVLLSSTPLDPDDLSVGVTFTALDITEHKAAMDGVQQRERLLSEAQALAHCGSWEWNPQTDEIIWSEELYRIYGRDPSLGAPQANTYLDAIHPDDREAVQNAVSDSLSTGRYEAEFRVCRYSDGAPRSIVARGTVERDASGNAVRHVGVAMDVTEQRAAERALRKSEDTHRTLLQALPDVIMRFDRAGRHLFVSENVKDVAELSAEQFIGKTHRELGFGEADCDYWEAAIQATFDEGKPREAEFLLQGDQGLRTFNWRLIPELDAAGEVVSVLSIARDITALRTIQRDYETLFREMLDGFALHEIICDDAGKPVDYRFLAVNPAFEELTGLRADDLIGKTVLEVMPDTESYWIETYGQVALTGEPMRIENYSKEVDRYYNVAAFQPAPGQFACIFEDVTARRRAERRQKLMISELDHRVKNNLAAITGLAEQSLDSASTFDAFREGFLGRIGAMARTHEALARGKWEGIDIEESALQAVQPYMQDGADRLSLAGPRVALPAAAASPLGLVLHELATNAVKYGALSCPEGAIDLHWHEQPQGMLELVWQERGGPPTQPPECEGTGLALIRGLISYELQGELDVRFEPGGFSCVMRFEPARLRAQITPRPGDAP